MKMGLDQAVLQGIENTGGNKDVMTKEEVEKLLKNGAYDIFKEDKDGSGEKESNDFVSQDIDSILARRAKTIVHENTGSKSSAAGGTFSKASFKNTNQAEAEVIPFICHFILFIASWFFTELTPDPPSNNSHHLHRST